MRSSDFKSPHSLFCQTIFKKGMSKKLFISFDTDHFLKVHMSPQKYFQKKSRKLAKKSIFIFFGMLFLKKKCILLLSYAKKMAKLFYYFRNTLMFWMNDVQLYFFVTNYLFSHWIINHRSTKTIFLSFVGNVPFHKNWKNVAESENVPKNLSIIWELRQNYGY